MTIQDFLRDYLFETTVGINNQTTLSITTKIIRRSDKKAVKQTTAKFDIEETNDLISINPLIPFNWATISETTKRSQLDIFARAIPIDNWYPLDGQTYPNLSLYYK